MAALLDEGVKSQAFIHIKDGGNSWAQEALYRRLGEEGRSQDTKNHLL
jgi:hypothetical protein